VTTTTRTTAQGAAESASVAQTLRLLRGVWHEHIAGYDFSGNELTDDPEAARPGPLPFEQLVYLDLDGDDYRQTNVVVRGRPAHTRTFTGRIVDGILHFDLPEGAPDIVGVSAGPGTVVFGPTRLDGPAARYAEPDWVRHLGNNQRTRTTALYRHGVLVRTLTANATRINEDPTRRLPWDPRGADGPVHDGSAQTTVYREESK